jgi:autotransporter-associated beta strand protein
MKKKLIGWIVYFLCAVISQAADGIWTNAADGVWSDTANWQDGIVASGAGADAILSNLTGPIQITNDISDLKIELIRSAGGAYTLIGEPLTIEGSSSTSGEYGVYVDGGVLDVDADLKVNRDIPVDIAGGTTLTTSGQLDYLDNQLIVKKGDGEWVFEGWCAETNASTWFDVQDGTFRLAPGSVFTKRGGNREQFRVGYYGNGGKVVVENNAELNISGFVLGHNTTESTGYMLVDGGTLTANTMDTGNPCLIGRYGHGTLCLSNNAVADISHWLNVGVFTRGELYIGGDSEMTISRLSLGWKTQEYSPFKGPGMVTVGSGKLSVTDQFVWRSSASASRTNLMVVGNGQVDSATLSLPATMRTTSTLGYARLVVDGGTLEMVGLRETEFGASLDNYLYGLEEFLVGRAGVIINTMDNDIGIVQTVEPDPSVSLTDGGVIKTGGGMLTLAGGCTCDGPIVVVDGGLRLQGSLPTGKVVLSPEATLSLVDNQLRPFAPSVMTAGQGGVSIVELEAGASDSCDTLALSAGSQLGSVEFCLSAVGDASSYWIPGDYVVVTYSGEAPDITGWSVNPTAYGVAAALELQEVQNRVVLHVTAVTTGNSVWIYPGSGSWNEAANWNTAPVSDPATEAVIADALVADSSISLTSAVTLGTLNYDSSFICDLSGSGVTFGESGVGGSVNAVQGRLVLKNAVALPDDLYVTVESGAAVQLDGSVTGSGSVVVSGGGTLIITNQSSVAVPVVLDGATLDTAQSDALDIDLVLGASGGTLEPAYAQTVEFAGTLSGTGDLAKAGANIAVLSGDDSGTGERWVQNGTLSVDTLTTGGELVIGEGILKYTGTNAVVNKDLILRTSDPRLGATFTSDADVTLNGNIKADNGVFIKTGRGTLTLAAPGLNELGTGEGSNNYWNRVNFGAYGESPTEGLRIFNVLEGTVVLGVPGQTNIMIQTVIIGGQTSVEPGGEKAGHLVINDGLVECYYITIGRGNGSPTTAPVPLESSVTVNGGYVDCTGIWMATRGGGMTTANAAPIFEMNGGVLMGRNLYCGNYTCEVNPRLYFNGGFAAFSAGGANDVCLAYAGGVTSETFVAGGTLAISNTVIHLADNYATAKGTLRLNSGRLITRGINRIGSGTGELYLNGGIFENCRDMTLEELSTATVQAGGFVTDVPDGLTLTVMQTLEHDAALGGTADGGVTQIGTGTLVIGGVQDYTGPTFVSSGVLRVTGSLAMTNLVIAGGATLSLADGTESVFTPSAFAAGSAGNAAGVVFEVASDGSNHDVLALPDGASAELELTLVQTGTSLSFVAPGRYPLVTFAGSAPDTTGWSVVGLESVAAFEIEGSTVYVRIGAGSGSVSASIWTNVAGGAWADAGNWSSAPANDASANVFFSDAIISPATITTGGGVTFGYMAVDNVNAYTWSGGTITLGAADTNATVLIAQGQHVVDADMVAPSAATILLDAGTALTVNGVVSGAGMLAVSGGGTLALTNGLAVDVPVTIDGATLAMPVSTAFDNAFTLGAGGAVFAPAQGQSVHVTSDITGAGGLTKTGSSILSLSGGTGFGGELLVRNGTVSMTNEPVAALVIGEGTFAYTGANITFTQGYKLRTTSSLQAATLDSDADITFNGQVTAENGAFIKLGDGTFTYAYAGENILSAGDNSGQGSKGLNPQPYGDTPTQGYRSYNVYNGKVVMGVSGQTNTFAQAVIIGGESTTAADAETAGHMEINGGVNIFEDFITVGRGNGTEVTAPMGLVSTLTVNGGVNTMMGFWMAAMLSDETTLTARPKFVMNDGVFTTESFYCGNAGGTPQPEIEINGGSLVVVGSEHPMYLAYSEGCRTKMSINDGSVTITNQGLRLAENYTTASGILNLNGGRLSAQNIYLGGDNGSGVINFNGGVFEPSTTSSLDSRLALTNQVGGAVIDVPADIVYTIAGAVSHDASLGATLDGGVLKMGDGTLVLSGTQAYTGPTVVSNGTLSVVAPAGGTFDIQDLVLGSASGNEVGLYLTADLNNFLSDGVVTAVGDIFLGRTVITLLPRGVSISDITNGTYVVMSCGGSFSGDVGNLRIVNGVFGKSYSFSVVGDELRMTVGTATSNAQIWANSGSGEWSAAGNWVTPPGSGAAGMKIGFLDAITAPATVSLDTAVTAGELFFDNANSYTLSGNGSIALNATNGVAAVTVFQGIHTLAVDTSLASDLNVTVDANAYEFHVMGAVTGDGKMTKVGVGSLKLSGSNTYAGGTEVTEGTLNVSGATPLGAGPVLFAGGALTAKGDSTATLANTVAVDVDGYIFTIDTEQSLTFAGDWTATDHTLLSKTGTNELVVAGSMKPGSGFAQRLDFNNGLVRFTDGADALYTSVSSRNCIDFSNPDSTTVNRDLIIEDGAQVFARCMYIGYGATSTVSVTGGSLSLTGSDVDGYYDALIFGAAGDSTYVINRFNVTGGSVYAADDAWWMLGVDKADAIMDVSGGTVSLGTVSLGVRDETEEKNISHAEITVSGGLLEARQRWNWMGDATGTRINTLWLNGGRLRLPATYTPNAGRINQSRLIFNGGILETPGNGTSTENPYSYLDGLKQAYVGAGGAVVDTQGRDVMLAQRLTALDGITDGGLVKRGAGTLTLAKAPCVSNILDVHAGTLRLMPDEEIAYPDDPMLRLSFENGIQTDDSAYAKNTGTYLGSTNALELIAGKNGDNALHLDRNNPMYVNYSSDMKSMESYTISTWVRLAAYQSDNREKTFFGNLNDYSKDTYDFLLRVQDGHFRVLGTGGDYSYGYGDFYADVENAVPLNTWVMLTYVVDGSNGFSMYVDGVKQTMKVTVKGTPTYTDQYGSGHKWYLLPTNRSSGKAFAIGTTALSDSYGFVGDMDDFTIYRRALSANEIALLHQATVPYGQRVRVATGAVLDLDGAVQELDELTGEGMVGNGTAVVTGTLNPGDSTESAAGALLSISDNLTLATNMTYVCNWTPEENDLVDVWGTLEVADTGVIDLGLTEATAIPGTPLYKSFPVMYYTDIVGAANFSEWTVTGLGRSAAATVTAADGVVTVNLDLVPHGTVIIVR